VIVIRSAVKENFQNGNGGIQANGNRDRGFQEAVKAGCSDPSKPIFSIDIESSTGIV